MNRRGFLKACAIVASGAIALPSLRLLTADVQLLDGEKWIGNVRELGQFLIADNRMIVRHDLAHIEGEQWFVQHLVTSEAELSRARRLSAMRLANLMRDRGWTQDKLVPLRIPRGYDAGMIESALT